MKLYIIAYEDDPVQRLIKWAIFHRMEYEVTYEENLEISGYNLVVTGDLVPETRIFHHIFLKKEIASPCTFRKKKGKYVPSFCAVTHQSINLGNFFPIYKKDLEIADNISRGNIEGILFHICHNTWTRYDILWNIISTDWYSVDKEYVCCLYYRYWIESYHKNFILTKNEKNKVWMREQCIFSSIPKREKIEGVHSMEELRQFIDKNELKFEDCFEGIKAYSLDVDVTPAQFSQHPFSIHGVYQANPIKRVEIDMSITLVGFYYDLGYGNKPKEGYLKSLNYFCLLKYPLVFFGNKEICDIIRQKRGDLMDYTLLVENEAEDWELIGKYKDDFKEMDEDVNYRKRRRYAILTCNKIYAVIEAIRLNPFFTENFAWCDPGIYRHELAAGIKLEPLIFKNIEIPSKGILIPTTSMAGGSNHEEYVEKAHESTITSMMIGNLNSWKSFHEKYDPIVKISFENGNFFTEQVVITRMAGIHPDLIGFREFTYHGRSVNSFLSLDWEE